MTAILDREAAHERMTIVLRSSSRLTVAASPVMAYADDPERFVLECFRWAPGKGPSEYQRELLRAIAEHRRISVQVESKVDIWPCPQERVRVECHR